MTRTVLVVDDEPDIRFMIKLILEIEGYEVHAANTGQEGIDYLRGTRPDAVLLDIGLPDMDGWDVIEDLRQAGLLDGLQVIVLTAHVNAASSALASGSGCSAFLSKPFRPEDLLGTLEQVLSQGV